MVAVLREQLTVSAGGEFLTDAEEGADAVALFMVEQDAAGAVTGFDGREVDPRRSWSGW